MSGGGSCAKCERVPPLRLRVQGGVRTNPMVNYLSRALRMMWSKDWNVDFLAILKHSGAFICTWDWLSNIFFTFRVRWIRRHQTLVFNKSGGEPFREFSKYCDFSWTSVTPPPKKVKYTGSLNNYPLEKSVFSPKYGGGHFTQVGKQGGVIVS